jgi:diaminohydroxyphosphoribosylaminopyrimidine deaminase/5-amino-6-(5-phosphoribosylamino)uracil reductase
VDILSVFQNLGKLNITSVLVEGGSELVASIVEAGLADKLVVFIAPKLIGGKSAPTLMGGFGASEMGDSRKLYLSRVKRFEDDMMLEYYFKSPASGKDG